MNKMYLNLKKLFGKRTARIVGVLLILVVLFFFSLACKMCQRSCAKQKCDTITVCIDPGHGGSDPGKIGVDGTKEKDINLVIAKKLQQYLEEQGIHVILTRTKDECLAEEGARNRKTADMNRRIEILDKSRADIFVSIHQNSFPDSSVKGAQCFYYKDSVFGEELATIIQSQIVKNVDTANKRKAKSEGNYFVLRKSICPAVIVECGFLSCPEETKMLGDKGYQLKVARAIGDGIILFLKGK